jgi:hypothetical protein
MPMPSRLRWLRTGLALVDRCDAQEGNYAALCSDGGAATAIGQANVLSLSSAVSDSCQFSQSEEKWMAHPSMKTVIPARTSRRMLRVAWVSRRGSAEGLRRGRCCLRVLCAASERVPSVARASAPLVIHTRLAVVVQQRVFRSSTLWELPCAGRRAGGGKEAKLR